MRSNRRLKAHPINLIKTSSITGWL
jgi:hypothetical protein